AEASQAEAQKALDEAQRSISNIVADGVPAGGEDDFETVREVGSKPQLETVRDHIELGELLGAIDTGRGTKVSGSRFYFLTGVGALLQLAMLQCAIEQAVSAGLTPMITPTMVKP